MTQLKVGVKERSMQMNYFPKRDTLRSKRNLKRRVRRTIRTLNKGLREDVFKDRFWLEVENAHIVPYDDNSGWDAHFYIVFHDRDCPNRDYGYWFEPHFIVYSGMFAGGRHVDSDLNDFIVNSDFWEKYRAQKNQ